MAQALWELAASHAQQDRTFRTTLSFTRLTAEEAIRQLRAQGFAEDVLPSRSGMSEVLNRNGYQLRPVLKAKPQVEFADHIGKFIRLLNYPPCHSKYNPVERCWGILEKHSNGAKLTDAQAMLLGVRSMTWKGAHRVVKLKRNVYEKGNRRQHGRHASGRAPAASKPAPALVRHPDPTGLPGMNIRRSPPGGNRILQGERVDSAQNCCGSGLHAGMGFAGQRIRSRSSRGSHPMPAWLDRAPARWTLAARRSALVLSVQKIWLPRSRTSCIASMSGTSNCTSSSETSKGCPCR